MKCPKYAKSSSVLPKPQQCQQTVSSRDLVANKKHSRAICQFGQSIRGNGRKKSKIKPIKPKYHYIFGEKM